MNTQAKIEKINNMKASFKFRLGAIAAILASEKGNKGTVWSKGANNKIFL